MKLSNATLSPGVVTSIEDPQNLGRIKCIIAGATDPNTMNTDHLPWCAPLTCFGTQRLSKPIEGQKVWVLHDESNYYEYYYLPTWEVNGNTEILVGDEEYDILVSRPGEGFGSQQYYTQDQGFVTRIGNLIRTDVQGDGTIAHTDGNVEMSIKDSHVYVGNTGGEYQPMVKGDTLYQLLSKLAESLSNLADIASKNIYTQSLVPGIISCHEAIGNSVNDILSQNGYIN